MAAERLLRTTYHDPSDPINGPPRSGNVACREAMVDVDNYQRQLERVHGAALHEWGIAQDLKVTATLGQPNLVLNTGIAADVSGQHISLGIGSSAETNPIIDNPGQFPNQVAVVPLASGTEGTLTFLTGPLSLPAGDYYFTIQWWETTHLDQVNGIFQLNHTPWLRLQSVSKYPANQGPDGTDGIALAKVTLDGSGQVTALTSDYRRHVSIPIQEVHFQLPRAMGGNSVDNLPTGKIGAHPSGGMLVKGQNAGDQIHFQSSAGLESVTINADVSTVAVGAANLPGVVAVSDGGGSAIELLGHTATINVGRPGGYEGNVAICDGSTTSIEIQGRYALMKVGAKHNYGEIYVYDVNGNLTVASDGGQSLVTVGGTQNPGVIRTFDGARNTTVQIEAQAGVARLKRLAAIDQRTNAIDVDAAFLHIHALDLTLDGRSGGNKRALVDWGNELQVNFNNDYGKGVIVNGLHLNDHIKTGFWQQVGTDWNPGIDQWITFFELDTGLRDSDWTASSMCETGMYAAGWLTYNYYWVLHNSSYTSAAGTIVIRWDIAYYSDISDGQDPFVPASLAVFWFAFRK
jgi:hypothetical protein